MVEVGSSNRFLGATWAVVNGPRDPRQLAVWSLEAGFRGIQPGAAPRPVAWSEVRREAEDMPFELVPSWRVVELSDVVERPDRGLAGRNVGALARAETVVADAVHRAARSGVHAVVLEPGVVTFLGDPGALDLGDSRLDWGADALGAQVARRNAGMDAALDAACRSLFGLTRAFPNTTFCLSTGRTVDSVATPDGLAAIFEDLNRGRLAYWHDAAVAACRAERLGEEQGEWLERFGSRLAGVSLGDWGDGELYLPPGAGQVDFPLLASYTRRDAVPVPHVIELDPGVPVQEISGVHSFLDKHGF